MSELPDGTITFLFTDIEGSTIRWERSPEEMRLALARHDELMQKHLEAHGGVVFKTVGDAFYVAFASVGAAVSTAIATQQALFAQTWDAALGSLRVRMALHTGEAERRGRDYFGQSLNRVARILSSGHGGQILLSHSTAGLVRNVLPTGVSLQDLGEHRLKDIQQPEQIFQLLIKALPANFPPLKTMDRYPNNLPTQLTPFVGRKKDLETIQALLQQRDVRLVTLLGLGGIGKTRLGLQVAAELVDVFPEGIYFVDLVAVYDYEGVVFALTQALNSSNAHTQLTLESIKPHLQGKILLLIDSFEQVVDSAPLIHNLLVSCHQLKVLVTSRSALHLGGEHEYQVAPLAIPDYKRLPELAELAQYESITLFTQGARTVKPDFHLTEANASAVAEICSRLDGLPLAIELAAARINLLSPQTMVKRLGRRLQFLTGGKRNRTERQQTLRGAIVWSYNLLDNSERAFFSQLAIFRRGCSLEAIETICQIPETWEGDPLELLHSLISKSFLRLVEQENGESRFEMLYTIREFALEQLSEDVLLDLRGRHAKYYQELIARSGPPPVGPAQKDWLAQLEAEYENIQAALSWCVEQKHIELGLRLAEELWPFWWLRGLLREGQVWFEKLLTIQSKEDIAPAVRVKALEKASTLASSQNDYVSASTLAEEALTISQQLGEKELMVRSYIALADVAMRQREYQHATNLLEACLKLREELGDTRGAASLLNNLGNVARQQGDLDRSVGLHQKSLAHFRRIGDEVAIAAVVNNLAEVEWQRGYHEQAEFLYEESLKLCRKLGYTWGIASSLAGLGKAAASCEAYEQATRLYKGSLLLFQEMDDHSGITACLEGLAEVTYQQNRPELDTCVMAQAEVLAYTMTPEPAQERSKLIIEKLHALLGEKMFAALWTTGHAQALEQIIAEIIG